MLIFYRIYEKDKNQNKNNNNNINNIEREEEDFNVIDEDNYNPEEEEEDKDEDEELEEVPFSDIFSNSEPSDTNEEEQKEYMKFALNEAERKYNKPIKEDNIQKSIMKEKIFIIDKNKKKKKEDNLTKMNSILKGKTPGKKQNHISSDDHWRISEHIRLSLRDKHLGSKLCTTRKSRPKIEPNNAKFIKKNPFFKSGHPESDTEESSTENITSNTESIYTSPEPFRESLSPYDERNFEIRFRSDAEESSTEYTASNTESIYTSPEPFRESLSPYDERNSEIRSRLDAEESSTKYTASNTESTYTSPEPFRENMGPNEEQNLEIRFRSDQTPSYQTHPQLVPSITRYHMKIVNEQEYYADDEETCTDTEVEDIML
ncbi:uncharacterized protein GO595_005005 [Histomonas meleagridis]|uniref:uncharacterized protein n=1 Tax=Histomonas meleagridis TaxID=135588 RepID=UPI0035599F16|nr:hypothetical protein GO595_005005 [Histomonas meleagridis]